MTDRPDGFSCRQARRAEGLPRANAIARYLADRQPSEHFIEASNVAALIAFLCSPAGADITGTALPVDGGWTRADKAGA